VPSSSPAFETTGEDNIRVTSFNSASGVTITVRIRFIDRTGNIITQEYNHVPATDRTQTQTTHKLGDGWVINAIAFASAGTPLIGQTFVRVEVIRGISGAILPLAVLIQGYLKDTDSLAWPGSPVKNSLQGKGVIRAFLGTNPAAGNQIIEAVPTGSRWRFLSLQVLLMTSATVANRTVFLLFDDGTNTFAQIGGAVNQAASQNFSYNFIGGLGYEVGAVRSNQVITGIHVPMLLAGFRVRTSTANFQAGDDFTDPMLHVEEWIEQ
jgi:hypothetical protein